MYDWPAAGKWLVFFSLRVWISFDRYPRGNGIGTPIPTDYKGTAIEIGKGRILREGGDVAVLAYGSSVQQGLQAAELLEQEGVKVSTRARYIVLKEPKSLVRFKWLVPDLPTPSVSFFSPCLRRLPSLTPGSASPLIPSWFGSWWTTTRSSSQLKRAPSEGFHRTSYSFSRSTAFWTRVSK